MKYEEHAKIFSETEQLPENLKRIKVKKKNPVQLEPENKQNFKRLCISIAPTYNKIIVTKTLKEEAGFNGKSLIKLVEQPIIIDIII